ncbi:MAG TPA: helix-turn-helix domain-containing protein [Terriglobales bacterium]|nr:helix-turn-helix domain-containing protein [Terriglobales bacterium]
MEEYYCPVKLTTDVIGGKWKPLILFYLEGGTKRFGELHKLIPGMTKKMLTQHLRDLERDEVIHRKVYAVVPPKVEYSLTKHGESLKPILKLMSAWGGTHRKRYGIPKSKNRMAIHSNSSRASTTSLRSIFPSRARSPNIQG